MRATLDRAVDVILQHEGGYANHPSDPGGSTNFGITQATARAHGYFGKMRDLPKSAAKQIYRQTYWAAVNADGLPAGVDLLVFDHGVNAGPQRAVKLLQGLIGVAPDGNCGPVTVAACWKHGDSAELIVEYGQARLRYYRSLKTWPTFGRGWARRVDSVQIAALLLAGPPPAARSLPPAPPPAPLPLVAAPLDTQSAGQERSSLLILTLNGREVGRMKIPAGVQAHVESPPDEDGAEPIIQPEHYDGRQ